MIKIYVLLLVTNKYYIGKTEQSVNDRFKQHYAKEHLQFKNKEQYLKKITKHYEIKTELYKLKIFKNNIEKFNSEIIKTNLYENNNENNGLILSSNMKKIIEIFKKYKLDNKPTIIIKRNNNYRDIYNEENNPIQYEISKLNYELIKIFNITPYNFAYNRNKRIINLYNTDHLILNINTNINARIKIQPFIEQCNILFSTKFTNKEIHYTKLIEYITDIMDELNYKQIHIFYNL